MNFIAHDPYIDPTIAKSVNVELKDLETIFRESDFLTINVPLSEETRHLVNSESLALMKPDAVLVNTAIAIANDPSRMGLAFKTAVEAGRAAYEIGLGQQLGTASATSPLTGFLDEVPLKQADG